MSILEGELAATIADALAEADIPLDVTLIRTSVGSSGDPWSPTGGSTWTYDAKGFADRYSVQERVGSLIETTDHKVIIVAATLLTEPETGDRITIQGQTLNVMSVMADPARALWELQCRA